VLTQNPKSLARQLVAAIILMIAGAILAVAQQPPDVPSRPGAVQPERPPAQPTNQPLTGNAGNGQTIQAAPPFAVPEYLTPIRGVQGVLAETLDGNTVAAQAVYDRFNPASSIKLATTLVALQSFGPDHRFVTSVWANGPIDRVNQTLTGDLVVSGRDPSLHYENAVMLARQLNELGIRTVTGNLIVPAGFTLNFDWSPKHSGEELRDTLDANRRSGAATRAWLNERTLVGDKESLATVPGVVINGEILVDSVPAAAQTLITHKSSRLVDILKVMLCYSNNFMAERIGDAVGGPLSIQTTIQQKLKINPDEFVMINASGLGTNRATPRAMMTILRALRAELAKNKLVLSDILPVAGIDPGTLEDRYTDPIARGSVIAKTGTLARTDGGASSLVGQLQTKSGRVVLFVIMNERGNVLSFRQNQDNIVASIQNAFGGPAPFDYRPVNLSMRLANSDYEAAKARGEYEPRQQ
jgi:D-alanyl-D-alanine carboxypeptidase/D-alanyl-D-alanine-endopeptidase (penicillin-binding protein 4)